MKEIPYSILTQNTRTYEIMLLCDQHDKTFADIAKERGITTVRVRQVYFKGKVKQIRLYINHISLVLEHEDTSQIRKVFDNAYECYQDWAYACAYLEKKYKDILNEYRAGEPGMSMRFIKSMPPFKPKLSEKTISRIIEMREVENLSYVSIGKELRMTSAKAKHAYEWFYHKQVLILIRDLEKKADSDEEKAAIWKHYFKGYKTSKKRYDALTKE